MLYCEMPMMLDDTQKAFDCCVSNPPDCERCPLFENYELRRKPLMVSWECRKELKFSIRWWLQKAKQEEW